MQRISKIIYRAALISIFFFVGVPIIGWLTPLEFTDTGFQILFEQIRFFGLPAAILLTMFGTIKRKDTPTNITAKAILTVCFAVASVFVLIMAIFAGMCSWTNNKVLFENLKDKNTKIVLRDYGCGAVDSGMPVYKVCKIKTISPQLVWVTDIDTTKINRKLWQRVDNTQ